MNWIPVEERLPRPAQRVLVFIPAHEDYDVASFLGDKTFRARTRVLELDQITHWAELETPESVSKDIR